MTLIALNRLFIISYPLPKSSSHLRFSPFQIYGNVNVWYPLWHAKNSRYRIMMSSYGHQMDSGYYAEVSRVMRGRVCILNHECEHSARSISSQLSFYHLGSLVRTRFHFHIC